MTVSLYMWRDEAYLLDMLTAARDACGFASGRSRADFEASRMTQYAVAHALQIIGDLEPLVPSDCCSGAASARRSQAF
jgi:uncharacterized protein with HEPN domain